VEEPLAFFRHVKGTSTLAADSGFAQIAIWLNSGFSNQSASERTNKYMVEVQGQKKATQLDLDKGREMLDLRMHLTYKLAREKAHRKEQREGQISISHDLRSAYMAKREHAKEVAELRGRLAELRSDERIDSEEEPLVTSGDVDDVLGDDDASAADSAADGEAKLADVLPPGYTKVITPPATDFELDPEKPSAQEMLVGKKILWRWAEFGWCLGTVVRRNGDKRRKTGSGEVATFILCFEMDEGATTSVVLTANRYSTSPDADYESWMLLEPISQHEEGPSIVGGP
jgi:hypothetical protein